MPQSPRLPSWLQGTGVRSKDGTLPRREGRTKLLAGAQRLLYNRLSNSRRLAGWLNPPMATSTPVALCS